MDEINNIKRLLGLTDSEVEELNRNLDKYIESAKKFISRYDTFEIENVKSGRLKTLLDNITYKVNFSYTELYKTANLIKEKYEHAIKQGIKINDALSKEIRKFLSDYSEKKERPL